MDRLFETQDEPQGTLTQRAIWWAVFIAELVVTQPDIREQIPDGARLVALPTSDLELLEHNLALAEKPTDKPQVFMRVKLEEAQVKVFAPLQMSVYNYHAA